MLQQTTTTDQQVSAGKILDGGDVYMERLGLEYLLRFIEQTPSTSPTAYNICRVIEEMFDDEIDDFPANPPKAKAKEDKKEPPARYPKTNVPQYNAVDEEDWERLKEFYREKIDAAPQDEPPAVFANLDKLSDALKFSHEETELLKLLYVAEYGFTLHQVMQGLVDNQDKIGPAIARMLGDERRHQAYSRALAADGKFVKYDIISLVNGDSRIPTIAMETEDLLEKPDLEDEEIKKEMIGPPTSSDLTYEDFAYLGSDLDFAIDLLRNAAQNGVEGINILLDGPTGGGKTELAKVIIAEAGLTGFSVGESEELGSQMASKTISSDGMGMGETHIEGDFRQESAKRFSELLRAQTILADDEDSALLLDEIEDLLLKGTDTSKSADTGSKIAINTFMLRNKRPIVFCGNNPEKFDPSVRNRFTFSIFVDYPPIAVRKKIWEKQLQLQEMKLEDNEVTRLARAYDASPRQITYAIKAAHTADWGVKGIERALPASARITTGLKTNIEDFSAVSGLYTPALSNISGAARSMPDKLVERAKAETPFSLLVYGPEGSGLKSITRYLSEGMARNPMEETMLDLRNPTQQQTPADRVAEAFIKAANSGRFLIINDIEHLSFNPNSRSGWAHEELPQFFATVARRHPLPFAVTSSRKDLGDELPGYMKAVFSDELKLGRLQPEQIEEAFKAFFGRQMADDIDPSQYGPLVVGDFANVKRFIARIGPDNVEDREIFEFLKREQENRTVYVPAGFTADRG